jgi:hypothetical protein
VYLLIPLVASVVGWLTNVVALKMTFYPIEFFGWKVRADVIMESVRGGRGLRCMG